MSQSDFNEMLLPKPEYPEAWECCGSECGEYCVYEIYQRDKIDYDAQQKRLKEFLDQKKQLNDSLFLFNQWWGRRDSNSHTLRRWNLNPVRLPIPPRPQIWL